MTGPPETRTPPGGGAGGRRADQGGGRDQSQDTANRDILQALANAGVRLRDHRPGQHRAPCPRCDRGPRDDALAVLIEPYGGGTWTCHRCGWAGGCRGETATGQPARREKQRKPDAAQKTARARRLINEARPACGTPAETYISARGLTLPSDTPLRFHRAAWHHPTQQTIPAMVAPIVGIATNEIQAAHLTFLAVDGSGKAAVNPPRLYIGPKTGGCVKLTPDSEVTYGLAIAEGIETGLAGLMAGYPTWACLDAGNVAAFPVLPGIDALTILADHDDAGLRAARAVADRWRAAGKEALVTAPDAAGADWADVAADRGAA